jgi:predicted GNAT family acetyltransferase
MVTTTSYGKEIAWIGNVVVNEAARGRHIGQKLIEHAVAYLRGSGIRKIALYCMLKNVRFYQKLGFVRDVRFVRLHRKPQFDRYQSEHDRNFAENLLPRMLMVDKKAFGADRSKLLRLLLTENRHGVIFDSDNKSFLVVKTYKEMSEFGPWVGTASYDENDVKLIKRITSQYRGKPIEASCLVSNRRVLNGLKRDAFRVTNVGYRMCYAKKHKIGYDQANFLLGFLDKG